jgi:hypothetical protein
MSLWNGDGGDDGSGFGEGEPMYEEEAPSQPRPSQHYKPRYSEPQAAVRPSPSSGASYRPMGAAADLGWVASIVDSYVTTPAFIEAQLDKIAADPKTDEMITSKLRVYFPFLILTGLIVGVGGSWLLDKWQGKSFIKNVAKRLLR